MSGVPKENYEMDVDDKGVIINWLYFLQVFIIITIIWQAKYLIKPFHLSLDIRRGSRSCVSAVSGTLS